MGRTNKYGITMRSEKDVKDRATGKIGFEDCFYNLAWNKMKLSEGENVIRILPPTWKGVKGVGLDLYMHYRIGPKNLSYLCISKMQGIACPICDARESETNTENAKAYRYKHRVLSWVIDRSRPEDGPKLFDMADTLDKELSLQCSPRDGSVLFVEDIENGYDVSFYYQPPKGQTPGKYTGLQVDRVSSPLSTDDKQIQQWIDFIKANPIPDGMNYFSYEHINNVFQGLEGTEESEETSVTTEEVTSVADENINDMKKLNYAELTTMNLETLKNLGLDNGFTQREVNRMDKEALIDELCLELKIDKSVKAQVQAGIERAKNGKQ